MSSVTKEAKSAKPEMFAQRLPGKIVIGCRLSFGGQITQPEVVENTLGDECGDIFQKALLKGSPYSAWPQDVHERLGSDYRKLTVGIYFD